VDIEQLYIIIGVNIALMVAFTTLILWSINKMSLSIKELGKRLDKLETKMDEHTSQIKFKC